MIWQSAEFQKKINFHGLIVACCYRWKNSFHKNVLYCENIKKKFLSQFERYELKNCGGIAEKSGITLK